MIIKLVSIGIIATFLCLVLRRYHPEAAMLTAIGAGALMLVLSLQDLKTVITSVQSMATVSGLPTGHLTLLFKVLGVSYLAQFASAIAKDAGEDAIAQKIEFGGKLSILVLTTPLFLSLVRMITGLLPQ